jgi:hypothetical protein
MERRSFGLEQRREREKDEKRFEIRGRGGTLIDI